MNIGAIYGIFFPQPVSSSYASNHSRRAEEQTEYMERRIIELVALMQKLMEEMAVLWQENIALKGGMKSRRETDKAIT